jgi:hypothetical protein
MSGMVGWVTRRSASALWKRFPWKMAWAVALWLAERGRERAEANLTKREQRELVALIKKSKGHPGALAQRDKTRLKHIAGKAVRG